MELNRPIFAPKPIIFMIVWPILYILMGISHYLLDGKLDFLYYAQLLLNITWSPLFFTYKMLLLSTIWLFLLLVLVMILVIASYKIKPLIAYLNIPYLLWLIFAFILNISLLIMN